MTKFYEVVIGEMQSELDKEYAEYQRLFKKFYLEEDKNAKLIYKHKTELLKALLKGLGENERS